MFASCNEDARQVIRLAHRETHRRHHPSLESEHLLDALLQDRHGIATNILARFGVDLDFLSQAVRWSFGTPEADDHHVTLFSPSVRTAIAQAGIEAEEFGHDHVGTEHLLLGLLFVEECSAARLLKWFGIGIEDVREEIANVLGCAERGVRELNS